MTVELFGVFIHMAVIYWALAAGVLLGFILGALLRMATDGPGQDRNP